MGYTRTGPVIYKYRLDFTKSYSPEDDANQVVVNAPPGEVLHIDFQNGRGPENIYAWMLVDTSKPDIAHTFSMAMTGEYLSSDYLARWQHITTIMDDGFVLHFFKLK